MSDVTVTVVIDDDHMHEPDRFEGLLRSCGLAVESCQPEIGVFYGTVDAARLSSLRALEGVAEAREEHRFAAPPVSSRIPQ